jgi:hypothetical protein
MFISIPLMMCMCMFVQIQGFSVTNTGVAKQQQNQRSLVSTKRTKAASLATATTTTTQLHMDGIDNNVIIGAGIGIAGLVAGIGLVAFTEQQGERAKERGSGLSDTMSTRITGQLMEDVEVSSVDDLDSLTYQLEIALKKAGGINKNNEQDVLEFTDEEIQKKIEASDDGW